ncbi:MarR family winged helix-turn-helix transcriptional regulator [Streptacidiphilus neutrinimicus]|uniref:MarR family winged helix-turn-helix transcriptional regulator n=1 Tax=Streptacidiphilus neutrinimicus TaxID=105420 RepID=UPI0005A8B141|nr:MarR family transcriptional regulator [Streptacidiphilus neutrinimicus]
MSEQAPEESAQRVYAVMRRLVLEADDRKQRVAEALGMSFSRAKALRLLAEGPLRMRELTARLLTDKPYTTLVVDDLEGRGFVVRSLDPDDRRCKVVTLTEAGREAAARATGILTTPPAELAALPPGDLADLDRILGKLH